MVEAAGTPILPETALSGGEAASAGGWLPTAFAGTADCALETADDPETITGEGLETATTGVTGTGLKATPANVEVVLELTEIVATDVSAKETATASGAWEVTLVSDCVPWLTAFWACSRANWKQASRS